MKTTAIVMLVLFMGCVQQTPSEQVFIEKTALLTAPNIACDVQKPYAYIQFVYRENGALKYANTDTTCEQLGSINERPSMGEQITIVFVGSKPIRVKREYGGIYDAKTSLENNNFFQKPINTLETTLTLPTVSHHSFVMEECKLLTSVQEHDRCLSVLAAVQGDDSLCDQLSAQDNIARCREWLGQISVASGK